LVSDNKTDDHNQWQEVYAKQLAAAVHAPRLHAAE
jgi:hypothetical protein